MIKKILFIFKRKIIFLNIPLDQMISKICSTMHTIVRMNFWKVNLEFLPPCGQFRKRIESLKVINGTKPKISKFRLGFWLDWLL